MNDEPLWMDAIDAVILHDRELAISGGSSGLRDADMLESALMRPRNLWAYADNPPSLTRMAAAYAFGISSNHPFVDGNKRVALLVSFTFLEVNGMEMVANQEDAYLILLKLAAGEVTEDQLAQWFEKNTASR